MGGGWGEGGAPPLPYNYTGNTETWPPSYGTCTTQWMLMLGVLTGCIELAKHLNEAAKLKNKVNQAAKELIAMVIINASAGVYDPVSVILGDGYRFIHMRFTPDHVKMETRNFKEPFAA